MKLNKLIGLRIDADLYRKFKAKVTEKGLTVKEVITEMIQKFLKENK